MEGMLTGDADRERAVNVLREAFTEGRLKQEEYVERVGYAYEARTYADLDAILADIPGHTSLRPHSPAPVPSPVYPPYLPFRPPAPTNSNATAALVCGVVGLMTFGVTSPFAVVLGHVAKHQIRARGEQGEGMATAGLVLGYIPVFFWLLVIALVAGVAATI